MKVVASRYQVGETRMPTHGPHRYHQLEVVSVRPAGPNYDVVRVSCSCIAAWRFLHYHGAGDGS